MRLRGVTLGIADGAYRYAVPQFFMAAPVRPRALAANELPSDADTAARDAYAAFAMGNFRPHRLADADGSSPLPRFGLPLRPRNEPRVPGDLYAEFLAWEAGLNAAWAAEERRDGDSAHEHFPWQLQILDNIQGHVLATGRASERRQLAAEQEAAGHSLAARVHLGSDDDDDDGLPDLADADSDGEPEPLQSPLHPDITDAALEKALGPASAREFVDAALQGMASPDVAAATDGGAFAPHAFGPATAQTRQNIKTWKTAARDAVGTRITLPPPPAGEAEVLSLVHGKTPAGGLLSDVILGRVT